MIQERNSRKSQESSLDDPPGGKITKILLSFLDKELQSYRQMVPMIRNCYMVEIVLYSALVMAWAIKRRFRSGPREIDRQIDRQIDKQIDRYINRCLGIRPVLCYLSFKVTQFTKWQVVCILYRSTISQQYPLQDSSQNRDCLKPRMCC